PTQANALVERALKNEWPELNTIIQNRQNGIAVWERDAKTGAWGLPQDTDENINQLMQIGARADALLINQLEKDLDGINGQFPGAMHFHEMPPQRALNQGFGRLGRPIDQSFLKDENGVLTDAGKALLEKYPTGYWPVERTVVVDRQAL